MSLLALGFQSMVIGGLLLVPLIWTETMPQYQGIWIVIPAPPAPPPPPLGGSVHKRKMLSKVPKIIEQPPVIPKHIDSTPDPPKVPDTHPGSSDPGAIPGGISGGVPGGVVGGVPGGTGDSIPPPVPPAPSRIRVGGDVIAAKLKKFVQPNYPSAARSQHIEGTVVLRAVINKKGLIQELSVMSGPSLLQQSALEAVRQWRYEPTLLNQVPVEVETTISVIYKLS